MRAAGAARLAGLVAVIGVGVCGVGAEEQGPVVTAELWKAETVQGEPVILAIRFRNRSEAPLRLAIPCAQYVLALDVHHDYTGEQPPTVPSHHHMGTSFLLPTGRELVWYANVWERYDLSQPGAYVLQARYKSAWLAPPLVDQADARSWHGEVDLGSHVFEVLPPEGEEANVYERLKPHLPEIWRDEGAPNVSGRPDRLARIDTLAARVAQEHPHSVYVPYLWWRFFYWYGFRHGIGETPSYMRDLSREFAETYADWPMMDQVRAPEVFVHGAPESPEFAERSPLIEALRAFAGRTNDLSCYVAALNLAARLERGPLGPGPF